jgi:diadenosine tetraphosphate (Ap4A) HIT family hydrolase
LKSQCCLCELLTNQEDNLGWISCLSRSTAFVYKDKIYPGRTVLVYHRHNEDLLELPKADSLALNQDFLQVSHAVQDVLALYV